MSFSTFEGTDQKLHLNLSHYANSVINNDMETFGISSRSGFINLIFTNFYEEAQASIGKALDAEKNRLKTLCAEANDSLSQKAAGFAAYLKKKGISEKDITNIMWQLGNKILQRKEQDLTALADSYDKGPSFKFRIKNPNYQYLTASDPAFSSTYMKAVLERYFQIQESETEQLSSLIRHASDQLSELSFAVAEERRPKLLEEIRSVMEQLRADIFENDRSTLDTLAAFAAEAAPEHLAAEEGPLADAVSEALSSLSKIPSSSIAKNRQKTLERIRSVMTQLEARVIGRQNLERNASSKDSSGANVRVNNENYEYLTEKRALFPCQENKYYDDKAGKYMKAVIEEYCRLPFSRRSEICFRDILYTVQSACDNSLILKLHFRPNQLIYVHPYGVETDPTTGHLYLVGYRARNTGEEIASGSMVSLRLSRIQDVRPLKRSSFISEENRRRLEQAIHEKGCAYIDSGDACDIEVYLTAEGRRMYNTQPANRPVCSEINGDIWKFHCTEHQIRVYFFKFGVNARIISPKSLAERFLEDYTKAADQYRNAAK